VAEDQTEMERVVTGSGLDWTIIRPPRLTNGPLTGHYQIEVNRMPRPRLAVSRADVAHFLLDEANRARTEIRSSAWQGVAHDGSIAGIVRS
jgi:hypothetical protein